MSYLFYKLPPTPRAPSAFWLPESGQRAETQRAQEAFDDDDMKKMTAEKVTTFETDPLLKFAFARRFVVH